MSEFSALLRARSTALLLSTLKLHQKFDETAPLLREHVYKLDYLISRVEMVKQSRRNSPTRPLAHSPTRPLANSPTGQSVNPPNPCKLRRHNRPFARKAGGVRLCRTAKRTLQIVAQRALPRCRLYSLSPSICSNSILVLCASQKWTTCCTARTYSCKSSGFVRNEFAPR